MTPHIIQNTIVKEISNPMPRPYLLSCQQVLLGERFASHKARVALFTSYLPLNE